MDNLYSLLVALGICAVGLVLAKIARRINDSDKGSAASAMYRNLPFSLKVKAWLRVPGPPKEQGWHLGRLLITESRASWRPVAPLGKPIELTRAVIVRERQRDWLHTTDLPLPWTLKILVIEAASRQIELALPYPDSEIEIVLYGLTHAGRPRTQPGHSATEAPTQSDT